MVSWSILPDTVQSIQCGCSLEVFRFWTFLKNAGAQGLYGVLNLKNTLGAKKIQNFYVYPIADGGLISMLGVVKKPFFFCFEYFFWLFFLCFLNFFMLLIIS